MSRIGRSRPARSYKIIQGIPRQLLPDTSGGIAIAPVAFSGSITVSPAATGGIAIAPIAFSGSIVETEVASGGVAIAPVAFSGTAITFTPFPRKVLPLLVELLLNGTWTDISAYVYQRADISITYGKPNEGQTTTAASLTLTINNRDGRFTPLNTAGAFYPFVTRNTQIRLSVVRAGADTGMISYTGYRFWGEVSQWPPQWDLTGSDVYVQITAAGVLRRLNQGAALGSPMDIYIGTLTGTSAPLGYWPCDDMSGASSFASGIPGGTPMTWTGTPSLASDKAFGGSDPLAQLNGSVWSGSPNGFTDGGSAVFATPGTYQWVCPADITSLGSAECLGAGGGGGAASDTGPVATDAPNGEDSTFTGDAVTVTAHGGTGGHFSLPPPAGGSDTQNASGGTGSTNTTHHDGGAGGTGSAQGGGGGSSGGSSSAGNTGSASGAAAVTGGGPGGATAMQPASGPGGGGGAGVGTSGYIAGGGGAGEYAKETSVAVTPGNSYTVVVGAAGAGGTPDEGGVAQLPASGWAGQVSLTWTPVGGGTVPFANVFRFLLDVPATGGVDGAIYGQMDTVGTITKVTVVYHTGGHLEVIGYAGATMKFDTGSIAVSADGNPLVVDVELTPSGAAVAWTANVIAPTIGATATNLGAGTVASASIGGMSGVIMNTGGTETGAVGIGYVILQGVVTSLTDLAAAAGGYNGERAATRFTRLCTAFGLGGELVGNNSDTPLMGPQPNDKLMNILQQVEDLDRGQLFESRDQFGMGYRTRVSMQNQSAGLTINYAAAQLAGQLAPTYDDQLTRNSITLSRTNGSSVIVQDTTSSMSVNDPPNGVGYYTYALSVNANADSQLANEASWLLTLGTVDQERYPQVTVDLTRSEVAAIFADIPNLVIGDYFQITNPPAWLPAGTIKQLAYGWQETLNAFKWTISLNAVPESPYEGMGLPTW